MSERLEAELVRRALGGDAMAFADLLRPLVGPAARFAYGLLQDRGEAEDAVQEASLRAWSRMSTLHAGRPFSSWFLGIVANQCREARRRRWRSVLRMPELGTSRSETVDTWLEGEELRKAVAALPANQRAAIVLHFLLDLPLAEVAAVLGVSVPGVKSRINRALKRLRPRLSAQEAVT
jgi:RNA polymerase sigma-70 factor (ECF subfamily)